MKVLVVGATGLLGTDISKRLKAAGHSVIALIRPGSPKEGQARSLGSEVRHGDLRDAASLEAACTGVDAIISTATAVTSEGSGNTLAATDGQGYLNLIGAAQKKGVKRFVYISVSPKYSEQCPLIAQKHATERAIRSSNLEWTILQPSFFMEVWFSNALGWDLAAGKAQIFGAGEAPISWISLEDVGAYAVKVLEDPKAKNQAIPLGGPEALSPQAALKVIEQVTGKSFKVTRLPGFVPKMASVVLRPFNPKLASLMALGAETLTGDTIDLSKQRSIADVPLTSLKAFAGKARAQA